MKRTIPTIMAVVFVLSAWGCSVSFRTGLPIPEEQVRTVIPGTTAKSEIFDRFGVPTAVVVKDEVTVIPSPSMPLIGEVSDQPVLLKPGANYSFDADTYFELFPATGDPIEYRRIYYYHYVVSRKTGYFFLLYLSNRGETKTDRLWVLVNEKTGLVEDYAFRKYGESVIFGRSRGENQKQSELH